MEESSRIEFVRRGDYPNIVLEEVERLRIRDDETASEAYARVLRELKK